MGITWNVMTSYPAYLRPRATDDLVRVGAANDGGYVLPERIISVSKGLLSFGLNDDCTFEAAFARRAGCPVVCFDHSVEAWFWLSRIVNNFGKAILLLEPSRFAYGARWLTYRRFFDGRRNRHVRKAIGCSTGTVSYGDAVRLAGFAEPFFLKIDIEGWEYRILDEVATSAGQLSGLSIEVHDIDLHGGRIEQFITAMSEHMEFVHFHPNSAMMVGPGSTSIAAELTFMNKRLLRPDEKLTYQSLPIEGIDAPNAPGDPQVPLKFD